MLDLQDTVLNSPQSGDKNPKSVVIFLHGVGADGNDLIGLAPWLAKGLGDNHGCLFLSPDAPHPFDMASMGRQWFSLASHTADAILAGAKECRGWVDSYINAVLQHYKISPQQIALIGFSQGTMMALYAGLRRTEPLAAIVGFSGALPGHHTLKAEDITIPGPPVLLVHGRMDSVVPHQSSQSGEQALKTLGLDIQAQIIDHLGHGINEDGLKLALDFLKTHLLVKTQ